MQQASVLEPQLFGTVVESLLLGPAQAERESRVQLALFGNLSSQRQIFVISAERDLLGE
jgi:predicted naringenin-chalcone synthase